MIPRLGGVVLCGGKSSRMGRPKAWLPFDGEPLLLRILRRVANVCDPLIVVAASGQEVPDLGPGVSLVCDALPGRGPLQGLLAGLSALSGRADAAFVCATDAPHLHPELVRRLHSLRVEGDHDIVVPRAQGHQHPLTAIYRTSVRSVVAELLDQDLRRPFFVLERCNTRFVTEADLLAGDALFAADPQLLSLRNINTPEDYEAALRI